MTALRMLVADDDLDLRTWMKLVLTSEGMEIFEVDNGVDLLRALAQEGPFDVVVTDVCMSWATGLQALSMARGAGVVTPFVVVTAHADESVRDAARRLGAELLEKPFSAEELLHKARGAIAQAAAGCGAQAQVPESPLRKGQRWLP